MKIKWCPFSSFQRTENVSSISAHNNHIWRREITKPPWIGKIKICRISRSYFLKLKLLLKFNPISWSGDFLDNNIHEKILDCDWLRGMQVLGNTVQKKGNWVQKRVTNVTFWLANKQRSSLRANQMCHLNGAKFGSAPDRFRAKTAMVGVCSTFSFATETTVEELKTCSKNENTAKTVVLALFLEELVRRWGNYWWNRKLWADWA